MKMKLKRHLQIRFVLLSVMALMILQIVIVCFSILRIYRQMTTNADRIILMISSSPDSPEIGGARYFRVSYDLNDKTFETDLTHISLVSQTDAVEYAEEIIDSRSSSGYVQHYRYLVHRGKKGISITFLSRHEATEAFHDNAETLILVSAGSIAVMSVLLVAVSPRVVSPIVKNHQRQIDELAECGIILRGSDVPDQILFIMGEGNMRTHHIHIVKWHGKAWGDYIFFRDHMNSHPYMAAEYEKLKRRLASAFPDNRRAYTEGKAGFIEKIIADAGERF